MKQAYIGSRIIRVTRISAKALYELQKRGFIVVFVIGDAKW